jgi:hypothetical protein
MHMDWTEYDDKLIIHAHLYRVEGGTWHSFNKKIK